MGRHRHRHCHLTTDLHHHPHLHLLIHLHLLSHAWVLVFDADTDDEAVYSMELGDDPDNVVVAFEDRVEAEQYAISLAMEGSEASASVQVRRAAAATATTATATAPASTSTATLTTSPPPSGAGARPRGPRRHEPRRRLPRGARLQGRREGVAVDHRREPADRFRARGAERRDDLDHDGARRHVRGEGVPRNRRHSAPFGAIRS